MKLIGRYLLLGRHISVAMSMPRRGSYPENNPPVQGVRSAPHIAPALPLEEALEMIEKDVAMGRLIEEVSLRNKIHVFEDRTEAGSLIAGKLVKYRDSGGIVLGIPSGGVPRGS